MTDKRPRGRPPVEKPRDVIRGIRFSAEEDELVAAAAAADGKTVATWIRERAIAAAKRKR